VVPESDFQRYFAVATEFSTSGALSYRGEPFIFQPPAYPALLGVTFKIFGTSVSTGVALNLVLSIASLLVMLKTMLRIKTSPWVSIGLLAIFATYPGLISFVPILGSETLSVFLVCLTLLLSTYHGWQSSAMLGALLAVLTLTRPQYFPLVGVLALVALWRRQFVAAIAIALAFSVVLGPWVQRNQETFGIPVAVSANGGYVAFVNNNSSNSTATWMALSQINLTPEQRQKFDAAGGHLIFEQGDESEKTFLWTPAIDRIASEEAINWIYEHPTMFFKLALMRLSNTFATAGDSILAWLNPHTSTKTEKIAKFTTGITIAVTSLSAVAAALLLFRLGEPTVMLAISIIGLTIAGIMIFEGQGRYLVPMLPAMLVCIALARAPSDGRGYRRKQLT